LSFPRWLSTTNHNQNNATLREEMRDNYVIVRLNRPKVNALNQQMFVELTNVFKGFQGRTQLRGAIICGTKGILSAGLDVPELVEFDRQQMAKWWDTFNDALIAIASTPLVTATAITGHAPAGGCVLSMMTDFRVMAKGNFTIGFNEIPVGMFIPKGVLKAIETAVGCTNARTLALSGKLVSPEEALHLGIVNELAEPDDVLERCERVVTQLLKNPRMAFSETKKRLNHDLCAALIQQKAEEKEQFLEHWFTKETRDITNAFAAKLKK